MKFSDKKDVEVNLENTNVYKQLAKALQSKKKCALATVVMVYGSAYRKEGAKMYVDQDYHMVGMISGGCLEADISETAQQVMASGQPIIKRYDLDEDLLWGLGLGCPGEVEIYIECLN